MKSIKKIMIWGSNLFLDVRFNLKKGYVYTSDNCSFKLSSKYIVDNYSMRSMSSSKASNLILKALKIDDSYNLAIIELGYVDMLNIINGTERLDDFKNSMIQIIASLKYCDIKTCLVTMCPIDPINFQMKYNVMATVEDIILIHKRINRVIKDLCIKYGVDLIDDNKAISKNKKMYLSEDGNGLNNYGHNLIETMVSRKIV